MFAEFERDIHARVDRGEPLAGEAFTKIYGDILRRYHGDKEGVVKIDDLYCVEWAYIPHFYNSFYVYQYATSIAASSLFAQKVAASPARRSATSICCAPAVPTIRTSSSRRPASTSPRRRPTRRWSRA